MPKNVQATTQLHSSHMLVMLKILQARLQKYMNCEIPDVQAGFIIYYYYYFTFIIFYFFHLFLLVGG